MLRSLALLQRIAGRTAILSFAVLFAAACGGGAGDPLANSGAALGPAVPSLGTAANFAALGGAGVTCTSPNPPLPAVTISGGDVGSFLAAPSSVTGFPNFTPGALPCSLSGAVQLGGSGTVADAAYANFLTAYGAIAAMPCPTDAAHLLSGDLGGMILPAGFYCISGVGLLTSQLTLTGGPTDTWIFKAASSITPIGGSVVMAGGANACNVYWQLGSLASFDNTDFAGNVLAGSAITFTGIGSSLAGRALAQTDVTLTGASIVACTASGGGGGGGGGHCKGAEDFVTGGGFIKLPSNAWGNFGVSGGIKNGAFWGHLNYHDHGLDGPKVKGTAVTQYRVVDSVTRHIEGTARFNRVDGYTYKVDVADKGERGRNDTFKIDVFDADNANVLSAEGTLRGGNIQLHKARVCDKDGHDKGGHDDENDDHDNGFHGDDEDCGD